MSNVTALPTAAKSYITVSKRGDWWNVVLTTPVAGAKPIKTTLYGYSDEQTALVYGRATAARMKRPFKIRGKVQ